MQIKAIALIQEKNKDIHVGGWRDSIVEDVCFQYGQLGSFPGIPT